MNYIDSNIFIYSVVNPVVDSKQLAFKEILSKLINNEIIGFTSFLTWDEFIYSVRKLLGKEMAVTEGKKIY